MQSADACPTCGETLIIDVQVGDPVEESEGHCLGCNGWFKRVEKEGVWKSYPDPRSKP